MHTVAAFAAIPRTGASSSNGNMENSVVASVNSNRVIADCPSSQVDFWAMLISDCPSTTMAGPCPTLVIATMMAAKLCCNTNEKFDIVSHTILNAGHLLVT
ncbi:unnamed protein product [Urochloa humidicola]